MLAIIACYLNENAFGLEQLENGSGLAWTDSWNEWFPNLNINKNINGLVAWTVSYREQKLKHERILHMNGFLTWI
jgi:hypothetical protein